jgi:prepilin-type N-terminal cleavage/methylation domain-containing protein
VPKLNRSGMTLVEMLIAAAILGIIALAMASLFTQQSHQQSNIQLQANFNSLESSIQSQFANPAVIHQSSIQTEVQQIVPSE